MAEFNINNSTVNQLNDSGDNLIVASKEGRCSASLLSWVVSAYGIVATTISIVGGVIGWYAAHIQYGIWFFGL